MQERLPSLVRVQVVHCIIARQENEACPGQWFMHELLKVRTFHETMPFLPEMQEVSGITPSLASQGSDKETLKVWAILAVFRDSWRRTLQLLRRIRHNRVANSKCCSWRVKSLQSGPTVPPIRPEPRLTLVRFICLVHLGASCAASPPNTSSTTHVYPVVSVP